MTENAVDVLKKSDIKFTQAVTQGSAGQFADVGHGTGVNTTEPATGGQDHHEHEHKINQKVPNKMKIATSLTAGAIAGGLAKTAIAPFDRTKIYYQTRNKAYSMKKAMKYITETHRKEGFFSLWRGNSATMARIIPYASIQYASHEQYKRLINIYVKDEPHRHGHLADPFWRFVAGSLAGMTSVAITYPLDMVRARMAVTYKDKYRSLLEVFIKIVREEKVFTLYRGFMPTIIGIIPYAGVNWLVYETLKYRVTVFYGRDPKPYERLICGALAGLCGQTLSYPLDIIRRRMQTAGVTGHSHDYTGIYRTYREVLKHEGFLRGMYKGVTMNWIKGPIAVGISFSSFDIIQRFLRQLPIFHFDESDVT